MRGERQRNAKRPSPEALLVAESPSSKEIQRMGYEGIAFSEGLIDRKVDGVLERATDWLAEDSERKSVQLGHIQAELDVVERQVSEREPAPYCTVGVVVTGITACLAMGGETVFMFESLSVMSGGSGVEKTLIALAFVLVLALLFKLTGMGSSLLADHRRVAAAIAALIFVGFGLHRLGVLEAQQSFVSSEADDFVAFALTNPLVKRTMGIILIMFPLLLAVVVAAVYEPLIQTLSLIALKRKASRLRRQAALVTSDLAAIDVARKGVATRLRSVREEIVVGMKAEHSAGRRRAERDAKVDRPTKNVALAAIAGVTLIVTGAVVAPWALATMHASLAHLTVVGAAILLPALLILAIRPIWRRREPESDLSERSEIPSIPLSAVIVLGLALSGCSSTNAVSPRQPATVVAIIDTSASMSHVTDAQWRFAVASVLARMQVGDRLCVVPVHSSVHEVDLLGLPCIVREARRGEVRDADIKRQYQRFWRALSEQLARWRGSGSYSDYQGALRLAADYFAKRQSHGYLVVLGDLADTQSNTRRRTSSVRLAAGQLKGVEVYLGGTVNTGQFGQLSWREIEVLQDGWVRSLEASGASVHLVRSNGFGLLDDWAEARLGPINPEFTRFHPRGVK